MNRLPVWGRWLVGLTILRGVFAALIPPTPEEAYHWDFAVHLDWSYLDHPGMIAWSIALGRAIFGDVPLAIRFVPLLFAAGTAALLARLATKIYGERAALWAVLLLTIQPVTFITAASGFPDSPLLFFWALTMSLVWEVLDTGRGVWWIAAGAALGLGMISKYTIVFFGVSMVCYLLTSQRDRRWLATPWPYVAAILALVVFTPVTYWNSQHDWASLRFQGQERFDSANEIIPQGFLKFLGQQWGGVVPLTIPLAIAAVRRTTRSARPEERYLFWCFAPMMVFFGLVSWRMPTHTLWPLPAWLGITVAMAGMIPEGADRVSRIYARWGGKIAGVSLALLFLASLHLVVFLPKIPMPSPIHGWPAVARRVRELRAELPEGSFVLGLGRKYTVASQLAWHLRAPFDVYGRSPLGQGDLQFDYWTDANKLSGRDAAVIVQEGYEEEFQPMLRKAFRAIEPAGHLTVPLPAGKPMRFNCYRARGYIPTPVPPRPTSSAIPGTPAATPVQER